MPKGVGYGKDAGRKKRAREAARKTMMKKNKKGINPLAPFLARGK